jgi:hypothetical protein
MIAKACVASAIYGFSMFSLSQLLHSGLQFLSSTLMGLGSFLRSHQAHGIKLRVHYHCGLRATESA